MNQYESMNDFRVLSRVHSRVQYRAQYKEYSSIVCRGHFRVHLSLLINRLLGCSAGVIFVFFHFTKLLKKCQQSLHQQTGGFASRAPNLVLLAFFCTFSSFVFFPKSVWIVFYTFWRRCLCLNCRAWIRIQAFVTRRRAIQLAQID